MSAVKRDFDDHGELRRRCRMKKKILCLAVFMTAVWYSTQLYAQTEYYVQSLKAKVMSGTSFKSPILGEVDKGFKFISTGKQGSWIKVRFKDRDGYVSSLVLATHPPLPKAGVIKAEDADIKKGVRRRASSYTSAAAARGLAQDDRKRLGKEERADYDALDKIESFKLSPEEIARFMEGNKL